MQPTLKKESNPETQDDTTKDSAIGERKGQNYGNDDFDFNDNRKQSFEEKQDPILSHICKILEESMNSQKDEESFKENLKGEQKFKINKSQRDDEKVLLKNHNVQEFFTYELFLDYESLGLRKRENNWKESYTFSTLAAYLSRHMMINSRGGKLDQLKTEQSLRQNLGLLSFIKQHKPFHNGADEKLLRNKEIFKHQQFLHFLASAPKHIEDDKIQRKIWTTVRFCQDELFLDIQEIYQKDSLPLLFENSKYQGPFLENKLESLRNICRTLENKLQKKLDYVNINSFYYIKMQIEELYHLAGPGAKSETPDKEAKSETPKEAKSETPEKSAIQYFATKAFQAIKASAEAFQEIKALAELGDSENEIGLLEESESFEELENWIKNETLANRNSREIWTNILSCYYDYTRGLRDSLLERLSLCYDHRSKVFIDSLLSHPLSFLMSKDILDVNWKLIDKLIDIYKPDDQQDDQNSLNNIEDLDKSLSQINIFCADLTLSFELTESEKDFHPQSLFTLEPVVWNEVFESPDSMILKDLSEKICSKIISEIKQRIEAKREEIKANPEKTLTIKKLKINLYSSFYDMDLRKNFEVQLKSQISKDTSLEQFRVELNKNIECFFDYTIKEGDHRRSDDGDERGRKISLFNYNFLSEVLLEKHGGNLDQKNFWILQEESKAAEILQKERKEKMQDETSEKIYDEKNFERNPNVFNDIPKQPSSSCPDESPSPKKKHEDGIFTKNDQEILEENFNSD